MCGFGGAWTHTGHGVLGGRYAKRCRNAQGRAGAGQYGEDGDGVVGADGHVGDGHEELGLGELDNQLAPAAEGNEGKHGAGRSGRGGMCASSAVSANARAGAGATTH